VNWLGCLYLDDLEGDRSFFGEMGGDDLWSVVDHCLEVVQGDF
jgi:hypothetical protein